MVNIKKGLLILMLVVFGLFLSSNAMATLLVLGDPVEGDSFGVLFGYYATAGSVDTLEAHSLTPGGYFEQPIFRDPEGTTLWSDSGWAELFGPSIPGEPYASMIGQAQGALSLNQGVDFELWFFGEPGDPVEFDFVAYKDGSPVEALYAHYDPTIYPAATFGWNVDPATFCFPEVEDPDRLASYEAGPQNWGTVDDPAFCLGGCNNVNVPEPSTLLLLGAGLLVLGLRPMFKR
jgi:hypothetical protein